MKIGEKSAPNIMKIIRNKFTLDYKSFVFPGGEIGVKLDTKTTAFYSKTNFFAPSTHQTIISNIKNSNDILELFMVTDALRKIDNTPIRLFLPYIPYCRQDRVCDNGESFSLKVFANLINDQNYEKITTFDIHSNVCYGVFDNLEVINQVQIINKWQEFIKLAMGAIFISPDAGANKKTFDLCQYFSHTNFIRADKLRDLSNGQIKETIVYCDDFNGQNVIVADDICDGGRTFTELAKVTKSKNCGKFILYVTHGIFSKGLDILFNNGIDEIWTTNSLYCGDDLRVKIFNLENSFQNLI